MKKLLLECLGSVFKNKFAMRVIQPALSSYQILIYHRVLSKQDPLAIGSIDVETFTEQMKLLQKYYHVISLETLMKNISKNKLVPGSVCVTFDDGYRDNYEVASPILQSLNLPATIFLATDFIGTGKILWYDRVLQAFKDCQLKEFSLLEAGFRDKKLNMNHAQLHPAFEVLEWLKGFSPNERNQKIEKVFTALGIEKEPTCDLMLNWDEVRKMGKQGISFGAHTCSHPILSTVSEKENEFQILESQKVIEKELGIPVQYFAYPNGRLGDYGDAAKGALIRGNFVCALTTNPGANKKNQNQFEINRSQAWEKSINRFHARMILDGIL